MDVKRSSRGYVQARGVTPDSFRMPLLMPAWLRGATTFWTLAWFLLRDFVRSPWMWFDVAGVGLAHLFFFASAPTRAGFFSVAYVTTLLLAALSTAGVFSRANHPHIYPILARHISKTTFVAAGMVAAWLIGLLIYVLTALLVLVRYRLLVPQGAPDWLTIGTLISGGLTVAVGATFAVGLMALLANFVSSFGTRMLVLGVMTISVMAFDPRSFPIENLRPVMERIPPLFAPVVGALRYATDAQPNSVARASLLAVAAYTTTIIGLVWWLSSRREVVIE